jgi:hypothetical protein
MMCLTNSSVIISEIEFDEDDLAMRMCLTNSSVIISEIESDEDDLTTFKRMCLTICNCSVSMITVNMKRGLLSWRNLNNNEDESNEGGANLLLIY